MAQSVRAGLSGLVGICLLLRAAASWALEAAPYKEETHLISTDELPSKTQAAAAAPIAREESEGFFKFLSERTQIGYGAEAEYNDNVFLQDNNRKTDYINTLEGVLFYNDPRGTLLYGSQWEVNALRYMHLNKNAINHDVVSYFDFDPGGRYQIHFTHYLDAQNRLVFGAPGVDLLRRGTDFQRSVEHKFEPRFRYALNEDDALTLQSDYSLFDDQVQNDASTDRRIFKSTLDWNHNLTRTWSLYGGTLYDDRDVPGDKRKSSTAYGGRLGARYELTRTETFQAVAELGRSKTHVQQKRYTDLDYSVSWLHALNSRTDLELALNDGRRTSYAAAQSDFRSTASTFRIAYALTPLITTEVHGLYERQKTVVRGNYTGPLEKHRQWNLGLDLVWQIRDQVKIKLFYTHERSTTRDFTARKLHLQLEGTF